MIYHCTDPDCTCVVEQAERPECCPQCGKTMEAIREDALTGQQWTVLGTWWIEGPVRDEARAYACFRQAAGKGEPCGISDLGWCLENGIGAAADPRMAAWLYEEAAELDYVPAMCNFGWCLQNGVGGPWNGTGPPPSGPSPGPRSCCPAVTTRGTAWRRT